MTHNELLDRIAQEGLKPYGNVMNTNLVLALRAAVELHKPKGNFADTYVNGEPNNPYCPECIDPDVYPCPTIQAIEEQLK